MRTPQASQIRKTPLAAAIRSMRGRLHLGQVEFTVLLFDRYVAGVVSRWERGQRAPEIKNLMRLLKLAETTAERMPILQALKAQGIEDFQKDLLACIDLLAGVQPYLTSFPGKASASPNISIAPEGSI